MQQTNTKRIQEQMQLGGAVDPLVIVQETKVSPHFQMVCVQRRICP